MTAELFSPPQQPTLSIRPCDVDSGEPGVPCTDVIVTVFKSGYPAASAMIRPSDLIEQLSTAMVEAHRDGMAALYEQMEIDR